MTNLELLEELKIQIITHLSLLPQDKPYLIIGNKSYTSYDLVNALYNEESIGDDLISKLLSLTIDLISRDKLKI